MGMFDTTGTDGSAANRKPNTLEKLDRLIYHGCGNINAKARIGRPTNTV